MNASIVETAPIKTETGNNTSTFPIARKLALSFGVCALITLIVGIAGITFVNRVGENGIFVTEHLAPLGDASMEIRSPPPKQTGCWKTFSGENQIRKSRPPGNC